MKARDIIPGWPRPRTVVSMQTWCEPPEADGWWLRFGKWSWSVQDFEKLRIETQINANYHARQQELVNLYRLRVQFFSKEELKSFMFHYTLGGRTNAAVTRESKIVKYR